MVIEKLTAIDERFMKSEINEWEAIFKDQYNQAKKEFEGQNKEKADPHNEVFDRMFKDQYRQFTLEIKENLLMI